MKAQGSRLRKANQEKIKQLREGRARGEIPAFRLWKSFLFKYPAQIVGFLRLRIRAIFMSTLCIMGGLFLGYQPHSRGSNMTPNHAIAAVYFAVGFGVFIGRKDKRFSSFLSDLFFWPVGIF